MRVYLDNCCYNRPFDEGGGVRVELETQAKLHVQGMVRTEIKSDVELSSYCMSILIREVGTVEAERFVAYINRGQFDYTKWQRNLYAGMSLGEIAAKSREVGPKIRAMAEMSARARSTI